MFEPRAEFDGFGRGVFEEIVEVFVGLTISGEIGAFVPDQMAEEIALMDLNGESSAVVGQSKLAGIIGLEGLS